jgi:AraC family transcriptional regulator, regulatory protein of adaptative response / methylated-DNA-[protein]-cysteine methyltransferase
MFAHAHLIADEAALEDVLARVVASLEAPREGLNLPLDIRGSAQEQAIWRALRNVPPARPLHMAR